MDTTNEKKARQVLTYNSKNFHWLNKKQDLERTMSGLEKISKKSEKWKIGSKTIGKRWTMNGLKKRFRKKLNPKNKKTVKIRVKLPHVNKKPLSRKWIFVQTPFSHSTLNLERKKFTSQNYSLFRSTSWFGRTKITTPIWLQKSRKCVNRS